MVHICRIFISRYSNRIKSKNIKIYLTQIIKTLFLETDYSEKSIKEILEKHKITNILNFAGQSYVSVLGNIEETITSQSLIVSRFLNIIQILPWEIKFINAGSSEIWRVDRKRRIKYFPYNPYGCAQLLAYSLINVRNTHKIWIATAILSHMNL